MFVAGVVMLCDNAPPSDHFVNAYTTPPSVCGVNVPIVRVNPTTDCTEYGVVTGRPSRVTNRPLGALARVMVDRFGWMSR